MSSSRFGKAIVAGLFTATILLSSPAAYAAKRGDDPRDPIVRFVKYVKKIFTIITQDEAPVPPHP
jgi:hypothetical protein